MTNKGEIRTRGEKEEGNMFALIIHYISTLMSTLILEGNLNLH